MITDPKPRWQSRTFWTFGVVAALSLGAMIFGWELTPEQVIGYADELALFILSVVALVLREKTTRPVGSPDDAKLKGPRR